ncbi:MULTISPECIES: universal stress protein [Gordonia]|jgi:nucleotide-binding universal stress UspA family protein|uniref:Universal stress protein n=2 Tax=Gordonia TaxID=2053 RepID=A0A9X3I4L3_9ACTN|nr:MULTISPECIES: universal stress protein [Gordonia]MAU84943.1 universal stress protein UspA [Gordonia sp. (in: high G+C Gram-positive bacteria)]MCF3939523.1 universal stress protein [Gordonia tangerina]MCX2964331.1 universal stress protein [Gordonia aquimaris]
MPDARTSPVVVGLDGSPSSIAAVEWAARDAQMRGRPLALVHVIAPIVMPAEPWPEGFANLDVVRWQEDNARKVIDDAREIAHKAAAPGELQITTEVMHGPAVPMLTELSENAALVVVGCRGQSRVAGAVLGSVSSGLAHHARCPVAVIHDEEPPEGVSDQSPVVVGVDGSPTSELATGLAFEEAACRGVELVAVHTWSDMSRLNIPTLNWAPIEWRNLSDKAAEVLEEHLAVWRRKYPEVTVRPVSIPIVAKSPAVGLLDHARSAQLVVVGSHGHGGFSGMLLGSVSAAVVNAARIPVIIARSRESEA